MASLEKFPTNNVLTIVKFEHKVNFSAFFLMEIVRYSDTSRMSVVNSYYEYEISHPSQFMTNIYTKSNQK